MTTSDNGVRKALIQARMDALHRLYPDLPITDLDRTVSEGIADMILDPSTRRFDARMAHEIFREHCPENHTQNLPLYKLPHCTRFLERAMTRAMLFAALDHLPDDRKRVERLLQAAAIDAVLTEGLCAETEELAAINAGRGGVANVLGCVAEQHLGRFYRIMEERYGAKAALQGISTMQRRVAPMPATANDNVVLH